MDITEGRSGSTTTLRIVGRVDSTVAPRLEQKVLEVVARDDHVVVDLREMSYVSSAGLRSFIIFAKHARARSRTIALCGMQEDVCEVFEICGLMPLFTIYDSVEAAASPGP